MLKKYEILEQLQLGKIVAVIRGKNQREALEISRACIRGGITNIEITFTTPNALEVIGELVQEYADTKVVIGAGTVLEEETARLAILNGAQYIVSPQWNKNIAPLCNLYAIPYMPGCLSPTEITEAAKAGVDVVKIFPGDLVGPSYISNIKGPFPNVNLMPSGGVNLENITEWLEKGSFAVGVGSVLTKGINGDYNEVEKRAKHFIDKVKACNFDPH